MSFCALHAMLSKRQESTSPKTPKGAGLRDWLEAFNGSARLHTNSQSTYPCLKKISRFCLLQWKRKQHISSPATFDTSGRISERLSEAFLSCCQRSICESATSVSRSIVEVIRQAVTCKGDLWASGGSTAGFRHLLEEHRHGGSSACRILAGLWIYTGGCQGVADASLFRMPR